MIGQCLWQMRSRTLLLLLYSSQLGVYLGLDLRVEPGVRLVGEEPLQSL